MIGPESQRRTVGARPRFISAKPMDFHRWAITAEPIEHIYWSAITNRSTGIWFCGACFIIAGGSVCLCVCVCVCVCVCWPVALQSPASLDCNLRPGLSRVRLVMARLSGLKFLFWSSSSSIELTRTTRRGSRSISSFWKQEFLSLAVR